MGQHCGLRINPNTLQPERLSSHHHTVRWHSGSWNKSRTGMSRLFCNWVRPWQTLRDCRKIFSVKYVYGKTFMLVFDLKKKKDFQPELLLESEICFQPVDIWSTLSRGDRINSRSQIGVYKAPKGQIWHKSSLKLKAVQMLSGKLLKRTPSSLEVCVLSVRASRPHAEWMYWSYYEVAHTHTILTRLLYFGFLKISKLNTC